MKIVNFKYVLQHGQENSTSVEALAALLDTSPRGVRAAITAAREQGQIILYAPGGVQSGYFLPSLDPEQARREMAAFYNVQLARCLHGMAVLRPVRQALGVPEGQLSLLDFDITNGGTVL